MTVCVTRFEDDLKGLNGKAFVKERPEPNGPPASSLPSSPAPSDRAPLVDQLSSLSEKLMQVRSYYVLSAHCCHNHSYE